MPALTNGLLPSVSDAFRIRSCAPRHTHRSSRREGELTLLHRLLRYVRALLERDRRGARLVATWREVRSLAHRRRMKVWLADSPEARGLDEPREIVADPRDVRELSEASSARAQICVSVGRSGELVVTSGTGEVRALPGGGRHDYLLFGVFRNSCG